MSSKLLIGWIDWEEQASSLGSFSFYNISKTVILRKMDGVLQESRRTVNPLQGKTEFLANETVKVNTNGGKQGGIPKKESPGIANNKSDPNGRHK